MSLAIAIFVKTPGYSPIKTRLAATHGKAFAERWHELAAAAVASVAQRFAMQCAEVTVYWAVAESAALDDPRWSQLPRVAQGKDNLGQRLATVYQQLIASHRGVLMIGADSPQLTIDPLQSAQDWLLPANLSAADPRTVLGFSEDGGFWIVGGNLPLPAEVWTKVRYSQPNTGRDMQHSLRPHAQCLTLPTLLDVDSGGDLAKVKLALSSLASPSAEQSILNEWMRSTEEMAV